ncbi:hypothetical protein EGW08_005822, partial [Elysia chlorotica]
INHITLREDLPLPPTPNLIEFLSAEKSSINETRNRFKLRFTKNVQDLKFEVFDLDSPLPQHGSETQEEGGISTFTFTTDTSDTYSRVFCVVSKPDKSSGITFLLDNSKQGATSQDHLEMPEFEIVPVGDIVYEPDTDAQFKVYVTKGSETSDDWRNPLMISFHVLDITMGEFRNIYNPDYLVDTTKRVLAGGVNETTFTVKTREHPITGLVEVNYSSRDETGALVSGVTVTRSKAFRPTVLSDIFPDGYVGFVPLERGDRCEIGKKCDLSCYAVGNSVSSMQVQEVVDGHLQGRVPNVIGPVEYNRYSSFMALDATTTDYSMAGETRTFRCLAEDGNYHTDASVDLNILYFLEATIDESRSNVRLEVNGNKTDAYLTCAVHGYPKPNMTFNLEYEYAHFPGTAPDEIITESKHEFLMKTKVTFDPNEGHGGYHHSPTGALLSASCETFQAVTYNYNSYRLPFQGSATNQ